MCTHAYTYVFIPACVHVDMYLRILRRVNMCFYMYLKVKMRACVFKNLNCVCACARLLCDRSLCDFYHLRITRCQGLLMSLVGQRMYFSHRVLCTWMRLYYFNSRMVVVNTRCRDGCWVSMDRIYLEYIRYWGHDLF